MKWNIGVYQLQFWLFSLFPLYQCISVNLNGFGWNLNSPSLRNNDQWKIDNASIPGDVYLSLFENGKIPDPYYKDNDVKLRWISYQNWTYQRKLEIPKNITKKKGIVLVADWLDTVTNIYINNISIGNTSNFFRTYLFDIRSKIRQDENILKIDFASPVNYSRQQAMEHKSRFNYSVPLQCPPSVQHGECHSNFIRKIASHFSWDWGPAFPTMGVVGGLKLEAFDTCFLKQFSVDPVFENGSWRLNVEFWLYCLDSSVGALDFSISNLELKLKYSWTDRANVSGINRFYKKITVPENTNLELWWPNGMGNQKLYQIIGQFESSGRESGKKSIGIGFRRVELVQDPIPNVENGSTFYIKINNIPIFLKGSNWIPGDSFLSRLTEDRLLFYFESMREANMNCIRAWGGGMYETEKFYQLADQYGIMIWQDMMFACNLYPATSEFLSNVELEIYDQINRLKHHPSIIIWAGNNENELGLVDGWYPLDAPFEVYKLDYLRLYNSTIYRMINRTDFQARPYVLSSPSNGIGTIREGGVSKNPGDSKYGDIHFYSYFKDAWDWKQLPIPRCVTEFGFQSYPSLETFKTALSNEDFNYFGSQMIHRQHHPLGQLQMLEQMIKQFKFFDVSPGIGGTVLRSVSFLLNFHSNWNWIPKFEDLIYLTQIHQAMAYKTQVEHYRRWRSSVNENGEGLTMCALYWQLNDIWQAPSWSSIDYGLKWKMVHYYAKRFYSPILVSPYMDGENLKISVINDLNMDFENVTVILDVLDWNKFGPVYQKNISLEKIKANSAQSIFQSDRFNGENAQIIFNTKILNSTGHPLGPNNVLFPDKFLYISTDSFGKVAIVNVWMEKQSKRKFGIKLVASKVAPFVWLNAEGIGGYFSDNGFTMVQKEHTVGFSAWSDVDLEELKMNLTVKTLGDLYRTQNRE